MVGRWCALRHETCADARFALLAIRKRVWMSGILFVAALTYAGYAVALARAWFGEKPLPSCIPWTPPPSKYNFAPAAGPGLGWKGDDAFWSLFPCERSQYRVVLPDAAEGQAPPGKAGADDCDATIVTAWFDIGRGTWTNYRRSAEEYLSNTQYVMSLRNPLVVFTAPEYVSRFVNERRTRGFGSRTIVIGMSLSCAPVAHLFNVTHSLMCERGREYLRGVGNTDVPERVHPWYNMLMWSKAAFFEAASHLPHVARGYYIWLDAGCHPPVCWPGMFPPDTCLAPAAHARRDRLRIAQFSLMPPSVLSLDAHTFYRDKHVHIAGGIFGTAAKNVRAVYEHFMDTLSYLLVQGAVDQDQTVFAFMYMRRPEAFDTYFTRGDWTLIVKWF